MVDSRLASEFYKRLLVTSQSTGKSRISSFGLKERTWTLEFSISLSSSPISTPFSCEAFSK
jgi:hypothetical protein